MSMNILGDVGSLLSSVPTIMFLIWTIAVGMCTGLLWQFLFWLIEDVSNTNCNGSDYVKTLQGLVSAIQTFGGEIPFLFVSGKCQNRNIFSTFCQKLLACCSPIEKINKSNISTFFLYIKTFEP